MRFSDEDSILAAVIATLSGGATAAQEVAPVVPDINQFDGRPQALIRTSPNEAITSLTDNLFQMAPKGALNAQVRAQYGAAQTAQMLSGQSCPLLALDLSFDGVLAEDASIVPEVKTSCRAIIHARSSRRSCCGLTQMKIET